MPVRKIAFVSCAYATHRPVQPAWDEIRAAEPDLLLLLGDTAYLDWAGEGNKNGVWDVAALEACYAAQFDIPGFRALVEDPQLPKLAVWDDHDCGPNDTMGADASPANLQRTRAMFDRWMGFAQNVRPGSPMYCAWDGFPGLRILMLDGRTWRTRPNAEHATLLGSDQEDWLRDRLTQDAQPRITIVATGSAFGKGQDDRGYDISDYADFAAELSGMLAFRPGGQTETDLGRRALFLGGDIHRNRFKTQDGGWHEVISSGVACFAPGTLEWPSAALTHRFCDNWGLLTIGDDTVQIDLHGRVGGTARVETHTIDIATWKEMAG